MNREAWLLRNLWAGVALAGALTLAPLAMADNVDLKESGTVEISQYQVAFVFSGALGGGTLHFKGKDYPFSVGGLGVGGFGASSIEATGKVYNLEKVEDFVGAYGQARAGAVIGTDSIGTLWLENPNGVYLELNAERVGAMLSLGADAVYIGLE